MNLPALIGRALSPFRAKAATEGAYRDGPWTLPVSGGWLPHSWGQYWNYWQLGYDPLPTGLTATVEACVSAYAQTIAMCPGDHWRSLANGGRERITTSALSRILRRPNSYQTPSDFLLNVVRSLYIDGNAYALALRNDRFEIEQLHWMHPRASRGQVAIDGSVFYRLGGNPIIDAMVANSGAPSDLLSFVPARDVLHVKLHCPRDPLLGESPIIAAAYSIAGTNAIAAQTLAFYTNLSRPSGTLQTDQVLLKHQVDELRERWDEQSKGLNAGGVPILTAGLKFAPMSINPVDSQLAEVLKLNSKDIAAVFRIPYVMIDSSEKGGWNSTEALMQFWRASGLGFAINHIELAYDALFRIDRIEQYTEFATKALLRSMFKDRIEALTKGVTGGVFAPNEARAEEELPAVAGGDMPRVQQQQVPLDWDGPRPAPAPAPSTPPEDEADEEAEAEQEPEAEQESVSDLKRRISHEITRVAA